MTADDPLPVHLCVLPGAESAAAFSDTVSCLRRHPDARLTIVSGHTSKRAARARKYVEQKYGNTVDIVAPDELCPLFAAADGSDGDAVVVFIPAGDWLSSDGLDAVESSIRYDDTDIVYVDEDRIDHRGHLHTPHFKPDANYEYLVHYDYVGNLLCVRQSILAHYGGIDLTNYLAARYSLLLRAFTDDRKIGHIQRPLYHSRGKPAGHRLAPVLRSHFAREDPEIEVRPGKNGTFRIKRPVRGNPRTTIVIPFRDRPRLLRQCLESFLDSTINTDFDVIGISNRSQSSETYGFLTRFTHRAGRFRLFEHNARFIFSPPVNRGVEMASGEYIVLMNNDITVANGEWLDALLEHGQRADVGVVGAKLLYPNGNIQHAGLSVQQSGHIGHMHKNYPGDSTGYMNRLICVQTVSAVTAALCLFSKELHRKLDGFDEDHLGIAYNDVDFCLRAQVLGYRNIFTPFALAYHHESLSRGYEDTDSKQSRFEGERASFWQRHRALAGLPDPNYNPNLDQYRDDFSY